MRFFTALGLLTIIPVPARFRRAVDEPGRSLVFFPMVGLIIGLMLAGVNWLFNLILPPELVAALVVITLTVVSGGMHLDGFADTMDGLGGHRTVTERWQAMRDSRAGVFGVIGIVLLLLVKYLSVNCLSPGLLLGTLVMAPVLSRWAMVFSIYSFPTARPDGLGQAFKQGVSRRDFIAATGVTLALAVAGTWWAGIDLYYLVGPAIMLIVWLFALSLSMYFKRMFAGLTGDTYGAINEVTETCVLLAVCMLVFIN